MEIEELQIADKSQPYGQLHVTSIHEGTHRPIQEHFIATKK